MFREDFSFANRFHLTDRIGKYYISTVDLGINHQWFPELPPLYYETMIFEQDDIHIDFGNDIYMKRYTTEEEAREGHKKAIEYVRKELMKNE